MNKILLVNPPCNEKVYSGLKSAIVVSIQLGLAYIGGVLEREGIHIEILDANALELSVEEAAKHIIENNCNMIFFTSTSDTIMAIYKICEKIKSRTNKITVVGGTHVTLAGEQTLKECKGIDIIVRGEGELTALELAKSNLKNLERIEGITYRKGIEIRNTKDRKRIENLDALPFPVRHLFPFEKYRPGAFFNIGIKDKHCATMITSRGCPNRCKYCASVHMWGTAVKFRSARNIVEEIEYLQKKYNTKQIAIFDDMFTSHIPCLKEFCKLIKKRKIKIKWWCYSRVNSLNEDILKLMKEAGCYGLNLGIESGNEDILKRVNKNITKEKSLEVLNAAKKLDLLVHASFMIGLPGDTKETVMQTINWAIELNPHIALFCITTPFPGTDLYKEAVQKGWISQVKDWNDIGLHLHTKYHNGHLSSDEIYGLYKLAQKKFFRRLGFFWQNSIHLLKNPRQIKGYILAGLYNLTEK